MNEILLAWENAPDPYVSAAWVAVLGGMTGILTMLLYAKISPQSRLAVLSRQATEARQTLSRFDGGNIREVLSLTGHALKLSLRQMGLILGPTLLAGAVVLGVAWLVGVVFELSQLTFGPAWAPSWLFGGYAAFWVPLTLGAIVLKVGLKIK